MNWDAIGAVGEVVGAAAVVISLVYVAIQIRQNTIATERSNARQTASDHERALTNFLDDDLAQIALRGSENFDALSPVEKYKYEIVMSIWLETIEQAYADAALGSFPQEQLIAYRNRLYLLTETPGGRAWWERRQVWFSPSFRAEVARLRKAGVPKEIKESGLIDLFTESSEGSRSL